LNEMLRRALFRTRLSEEDVAAHLGVDPKTVRRWLEGRLPYPRHRLAVSELLGADEADLWPEVHVVRAASSRHEEITAVYPHMWAVPHEEWRRFFGSAEREIDILTYSGLFLIEDVGLMDLFVAKARAEVRVRIALGDPDSSHVTERGVGEGIDHAIPTQIRRALTSFAPLLDASSVEIRMHRATLYSSLYRADNDLLVDQHVYGIPAANAPVLHLRRGASSEMFNSYADSFERIWFSSKAWPGVG
jgi:transcriptional regulator with XRE-family HTH domain